MTTVRPVLTEAEIAAVRKPYRAAALLPGRAYHDEAIFEHEQREWLGHDWVCVGRAEDAEEPGTWFQASVGGEPLLVVRGRDGVLRGFYNVCRHRGTAVVEEPAGKAVRFQCPYHAWIYDLDGRLVRAKHTEELEDFSFDGYGLVPVGLEVWQGFVFVNLDPDAAPLAAQLGDLVGPEQFGRFDFSVLRLAHREVYDVAANWKFIAENYSECYHCPGIHPQLNRLTPYDVGGDFEPDGQWQGGWMELVESAETMALRGGQRNGRPPMAGITELDERRILYYVVWPLMFLSIHPDYLLVHRLEPLAPGRTRVICDWLFEPATIAAPGFDPSDAVGFWDLTNRQDWHVCELQQQGTASRSWSSGRFSTLEASVHAFDLMCVDRYAGDGRRTQREILDRRLYDRPKLAVTTPDSVNGAGGDAVTGAPAGEAESSARSAARTRAAAARLTD
jgi:Rieske 2Fe-2S family protein